MPEQMKRLHQNHGRYNGDRPNIQQALGQIEQAAASADWERRPLQMPDQRQTTLGAYASLPPDPRAHIYISSGIHGDEPAGPLAVLKLFQQAVWPDDVALWIIPCLNPGGFALGRWENEDGVDLNRDYRALKTDLVRAHIQWLQACPRFDVTLLLHEDWEAQGFYLYELNPSKLPSLAPTIIAEVEKVCPIDHSPVIEGRKAQKGIIRPRADISKRPDWPEAFYLVQNKSPLSYTLEAPSDFPLATRVNALAAGVTAVLNALGIKPFT